MGDVEITIGGESMSGMNVANSIFILVGVILLSISHGLETGLGLGMLAFAVMPYHK